MRDRIDEICEKALHDRLAQIRERLDRSKWEGDALDQIADLERSQEDVPRLLAAVDAVLVACDRFEQDAKLSDRFAPGLRVAAKEMRRTITYAIEGDPNA